jgi:catechol 2,3-dioxygenase-like lactoylglutathione lyase family enzyme
MPIVYQSAVLLVHHMGTARTFYEDLLEQEVVLDLGANVGYKAGFALWERAHAESIIYGHAESDGPAPAREPFELYFEADDVPGVWDRMLAAGVQPVHEIREQPWGQLVFRVYDPDRHIIEVGEPMPAVIVRFLNAGLTVEETAARTSMPVDIIHQVALTASAPPDIDLG